MFNGDLLQPSVLELLKGRTDGKIELFDNLQDKVANSRTANSLAKIDAFLMEWKERRKLSLLTFLG